ncbi:substrate-binding periplasmic protein [Chitinimonas naiadis]
MMPRYLALLLLTLPLYAETLVQACGGEVEWVPSSYFKRQDGKKTGEIAGYSPDVLNAALAESGYRVEITLLPWTRCQREVQDGLRFQLAMGVQYSEERARLYRLSAPYLRFQPAYFYRRDRFPQGLDIQHLSQLGSYRVCGLLGYNYAFTGLRPEQIDTGALDYAAALGKLALGRCDMLIETLEVMAGQRRLGRLPGDASVLEGRPLPEVAPVVAHFAISPQMPNGNDFLRRLDEGVARLQRSRQLAELLRRHTEN